MRRRKSAATARLRKWRGRSRAPTGRFGRGTLISLAGPVDYQARGITLDARLDQSPMNWLEAKGYVPVAAFKSPSALANRNHAAAPKEDSFDLHVNSTAIDLGLVQGLTPALTNVSGTAQATIDITGAASDPHPNGVVVVENAAFT